MIPNIEKEIIVNLFKSFDFTLLVLISVYASTFFLHFSREFKKIYDFGLFVHRLLIRALVRVNIPGLLCNSYTLLSINMSCSVSKMSINSINSTSLTWSFYGFHYIIVNVKKNQFVAYFNGVIHSKCIEIYVNNKGLQ